MANMLVENKRYLDGILDEPEEATILSLTTDQKGFYVTVYHKFLYVKVNSKKTVKKCPFLLFSENADVGIFVEIQG